MRAAAGSCWRRSSPFAREGGYEQALKSYVREAAWVQAQYLVGQKGVGCF
jgi:hypothetical protein